MHDPARIEASMRGLLARRSPGASICPSEVARALDPEGWRAWMPAVRDVAARLAEAGVVRVTQGEAVIEPARVPTVPGTVRLRRGVRFALRATDASGAPEPGSN